MAKKKETKDAEGFIEIPFGAFDSETIGWTYTIPEGFTAKIEDGKIVVEKKESDDEKIRKELLIDIPKVFPHDKAFKYIAYLEKQKEQEPSEQKYEDEKLHDIVIAELGKYNGENHWKAPWAMDSTGLQCPLYFANLGAKWQKEQQPAEVDEYKIIKKHITEDSLSSEVNKRLTDCGWYVTDKKPAGWNEEDKKIMESLLRHFSKKYKTKPYWNGIAVKNIITYLEKQKAKDSYDRMAPIYEDRESFESALDKAWKFYNESGSSTVDGCEDNSMELSFAKGFREGVLYEKQKCGVEIEKAYKNADKIQYEKGFGDGAASVKPTEWSEEDERMLAQVEYAMKAAYSIPRNLIGWAMDHIKPQPHWKPSEEQMKIFNEAIEHYSKYWDSEDIKILCSLYADLQKLL